MKDIFRKHGNKILAVLGVILMIVWLSPNALPTAGDQEQKRSRGTLHGVEVTNRDLGYARTDVTIWKTLVEGYFEGPLSRLAGLAQTGDRAAFSAYLSLLQRYRASWELVATERALDKGEPDIHAFLLLHQVRQAGLTATPEELNSLNERLGLADSELPRYFRDLGRRDINTALADAIAIQKYNTFAERAVLPSRPELEHFATAVAATVQVQFATLDANTPRAGTAEPPAEAVQKLLDTYKGRLPFALQPLAVYGAPPVLDGHTYPFGYMYPDRVQVEYLTIRFEDLKAKFPPTPQDLQAAAAYFRQHPEEAEAPATAPGTPPASQPAPRTFDDPEVRTRVLERVVRARVEKIIEKMVADIKKNAKTPFQEDGTGFQVRAEDAPLVSYETLGQGVQKSPDFGGYLPTYEHPGFWLDARRLSALKGIGRAGSFNGPQMVAAFPDLALHVRELDDSPKKNANFRQLQTEAEGPVLFDAEGNAYIYRVIATEKSHVPATAEEIQEQRAQAAEDLKRLAAFELDKTLAQQMVTEGMERSLELVAKQRNLPVKTAGPFSRMVASRPGTDIPCMPTPAPIPGLTDQPGLRSLPLPAFTDAAFMLAAQRFGEKMPAAPATTGTAPAPATVPAATLATGTSPKPLALYNLAAVPVESRLQVFVLQLDPTEYKPVSITDVTNPVRAQQFVDRNVTGAWLDWMEPHWNRLRPLAERLDFKPSQPFAGE